MSSEKKIEVIADAITKQVEELEISHERLAELEAENLVSIQAQQAKEEARTSALAKLAALGLTEEEIAAL